MGSQRSNEVGVVPLSGEERRNSAMFRPTSALPSTRTLTQGSTRHPSVRVRTWYVRTLRNVSWDVPCDVFLQLGAWRREKSAVAATAVSFARVFSRERQAND